MLIDDLLLLTACLETTAFLEWFLISVPYQSWRSCMLLLLFCFCISISYSALSEPFHSTWHASVSQYIKCYHKFQHRIYYTCCSNTVIHFIFGDCYIFVLTYQWTKETIFWQFLWNLFHFPNLMSFLIKGIWKTTDSVERFLNPLATYQACVNCKSCSHNRISMAFFPPYHFMQLMIVLLWLQKHYFSLTYNYHNSGYFMHKTCFFYGIYIVLLCL